MNTRNTFYKIIFISICLLGVDKSYAQSKSPEENELQYVLKFVDNLLKYGKDTYGTKNTPMWASVIDVNSCTVPIRNVPPTKGIRPHDRAVGGSNLYHDVTTLKVFDVLTQITGNGKYRDAAHAYSKSFLELAQNPSTGLLGWGEHLYYNFYVDTVMIGENRILDPRQYFQYPHELLAWTPPWAIFWEMDNEKTHKAIDGLKFHYNGPDPKVYLFNRHAVWNKPVYQTEIMPWIKHAALFSYSFAFLFDKTNEPKWNKWSEDAGMLYWNLRNKETNLVFGCYYHPREEDAGKLPSIGGTALYSYWLHKASTLNHSDEMRTAALQMMKAYDTYGWNDDKNGYYNELHLDGSLPKNAKIATPWKIGYGSSSVLLLGRVAAYLYAIENEYFLREMAVKSATAINAFPLPEKFTAQNIGEAINLNMDLYQITKDSKYLHKAKEYAEIAEKHLWKNDFFVRQKNDHYYEAKLGIGDLLAGLLRIHIAENNLEIKADWSF